MFVRRNPGQVQAISEEIVRCFGEEAGKMASEHVTEEDKRKFKECKEESDQKRAESRRQTEKIDAGGFIISKKTMAKPKLERTCPVCNTFSFCSKDDVYMLKFGCCEHCFIIHIEGREERWKKGWRPNERQQV